MLFFFKQNKLCRTHETFWNKEADVHIFVLLLRKTYCLRPFFWHLIQFFLVWFRHQFFSIGCTIGGLVMKFSEPLLSLDGIVLLNNVSLGSLPFGSLLYTLDMCLVSSFVVDTVYVVLVFCGICKRSKGWLIAVSIFLSM